MIRELQTLSSSKHYHNMIYQLAQFAILDTNPRTRLDAIRTLDKTLNFNMVGGHVADDQLFLVLENGDWVYVGDKPKQYKGETPVEHPFDLSDLEASV